MSDSTKTDNIDLLDAGSYRWQLATRYNSNSDEHLISTVNTDWEHQMIHEGKGFSLSGKVTGLGAGVTAYMLAKNQNGTPVHWRAATLIVEDGEVNIVFYEDPTTSADGSQLNTYNKNRAVTKTANTATLEVYSGPTVTDVGTPLEYGYIPDASGGSGGGGGRTSGGEASRVGGEWILATSTDYLIGITNNSGAAIDYSYIFFWYELDA